MKKSAKQWELTARFVKQKELKELMDEWMLQRFKSIIADQMPKKTVQRRGSNSRSRKHLPACLSPA